MPIKLSAKETQARSLLIKVAMGEIETRFPRLIGYKEFWDRIFPNEVWGQVKQRTITPIITKISIFELEHGRPPLNELVVRMDTREPGYSWEDLRNGWRDEFNMPLPPYESHAAAQRACWDVWGDQVARPAPPPAVEEGEPEDRTAQFRRRNANIIQECKTRDDYTCKSCEFRLKIGNSYIIDCHHKYPLGNRETAKITYLGDLICLCPTCHRIAHTGRPLPLRVDGIRKARETRQK